VQPLENRNAREQLEDSGERRPKVITLDGSWVHKVHEDRIVVSHLEGNRQIWFGGADRSVVSMDEFYRFLGEKLANALCPAVMDMWIPFRDRSANPAPRAAILIDRFHGLRHLSEA
jgi:transposase